MHAEKAFVSAAAGLSDAAEASEASLGHGLWHRNQLVPVSQLGERSFFSPQKFGDAGRRVWPVLENRRTDQRILALNCAAAAAALPKKNADRQTHASDACARVACGSKRDRKQPCWTAGPLDPRQRRQAGTSRPVSQARTTPPSFSRERERLLYPSNSACCARHLQQKPPLVVLARPWDCNHSKGVVDPCSPCHHHRLPGRHPHHHPVVKHEHPLGQYPSIPLQRTESSASPRQEAPSHHRRQSSLYPH